jgi:hypothetical protein
VAEVEPEWDDVEREWMLARQHYRDVTLCHLCGMPREVCRAYDTDGMVSVTTERCHFAAAVARARRANEQAEIDLPETLAYEARLMDAPTVPPPEVAP